VQKHAEDQQEYINQQQRKHIVVGDVAESQCDPAGLIMGAARGGWGLRGVRRQV
jgi:hypothetical protein